MGEGKVKKISLEALRELKERGITTEKFLDYLCQQHGVLLHGSIYEISDDKLRSRLNKVFASNKSAIAIMRSIYSNVNVNLEYPYFITEKNPLALKVHTPSDGKFIKVNKGYVYIVNAAGLRNEPEKSWQFIKEVSEVDFIAVVEIESGDFKYPVKFFNDYKIKINHRQRILSKIMEIMGRNK